MSDKLGYWKRDRDNFGCVDYDLCSHSSHDTILTIRGYKDKDESEYYHWSIIFDGCVYRDVGDWDIEEAKSKSLMWLYNVLVEDVEKAQNCIKIIKSMESQDE